MTSEIKVVRDAGLLRISLDRPERKNAMSTAMVARLTELFEQTRGDASVRVVLIDAIGADFSAGGDLGDMASVLAGTHEDRSRTFRDLASNTAKRLFLAMHALPQPIVLAARGHVIGAGVQMAAVADLVVASETAKFWVPQVDLAHTVDHGESWHLVRKIGMTRAMQMCLMAERIDGATAERFGLANWLVADSELDARAEAIARRIAASPPVAVRGMKSLLRASEGSSLEDQFAREADMLGQAVATDDFVEAIGAFADKRVPVFTGR